LAAEKKKETEKYEYAIVDGIKEKSFFFSFFFLSTFE
jgi:hypothetical protein